MEVKSKNVFDLLVSLCKVHDLDQMRVLIILGDNKIDWNLFLACCFKNKVAGLVYSNIKRLKIQNKVPHRILYAIKYFHYCNKKRNKVILNESKLLSNELSSKSISALFLKGSILLPVIYKDEGARMLNDIDIYIKKNSRERVHDLMESLGYIQGEYNEATQQVDAITHQEKLLWKLKMFNLPPYHKVIIEGLHETVAVDFSFGLSFSEKSDLSEIMFADPEYRATLPTLSSIKLFIQICCHLHKEATNSAWQEIGQDINLIKFCDVRESYYEFIRKENAQELADTSKLLGVEIAVKYSLKHTAVIYSDDELASVADMIEVDDYSDERNIYNQGSSVVGKRSLSIPDAISSL